MEEMISALSKDTYMCAHDAFLMAHEIVVKEYEEAFRKRKEGAYWAGYFAALAWVKVILDCFDSHCFDT